MYFPSHPAIPRKAVSWRFSSSGGPGGQHVNKVATTVTLRVAVDELHVARDVRERLLAIAPTSNNEQREIIIRASAERSQWRNRLDAWEQLLRLVETASKRRKRRIRTKPTAASKRRRLDQKRRQSELKSRRRKPDLD